MWSWSSFHRPISVVTEFGFANLFGKNLRERAEALIGIAHPKPQPVLEQAARKRKLLT